MATAAGSSVPSTTSRGGIRVVVIEDSPLQSEALVRLYEEDGGLQVVATASTGEAGVQAVLTQKPDLVSCDIGLPDIDGFEVVTRIMAEHPTPIVVMTASLRPRGRRDAFDALSLGAVDVIEKPTQAQLRDSAWRKRLRQQLRITARSHVIPHVFGRVRHRFKKTAQPTKKTAPHPAAASRPTPAAVTGPDQTAGIVAVVASAGGPQCVQNLLEGLRPSFPLRVPLVVSLHLSEVMATSYAAYLARVLKTRVVEIDGSSQLLEGGIIYVTPGGRHTEMARVGIARVIDAVPGARYTPSFDHWLSSVARVYGAAAIGVILTGMGADGAQGMLAIRNKGGATLGQNEASCLVYGMPKAAFELGAVKAQMAPEAIAHTVTRWLATRKPGGRGD